MIARVLDDARAGSTGALVLSGEPGIGKSTLLERAAADATGFRTLWTLGVENDAVLGHAGLLPLLTPLRDLLDQVPEAQAAALAGALGWSTADRPPAPLLVAGATLALLSVAAADGPLLVVVDDAHWLDHESASALLFAVRRMRDDPVVFLLAARAESPAAYELADLPLLSLAGLTAAQVREAWPDLVPDVAALLADQTLGNPLVLGDVVPLLSAAQQAGAAPLPVPLPVGARPLGSLAARLVGLSEDAAHVALLYALAGAGEEYAVEAAAVADGVLLDAALDDALAARVLAREAGLTRLAHPLLRTAVLAHSTPARRRAAHASLAAASASLGRTPAAVWHRAEATAGTDDGLARELAALADDRHAGGRAVASQALERASTMTTDTAAGLSWLARAAEESFLAGDLPRTRAVAERVLAASPSPRVRAQVLSVLGSVEEYAGSLPRAEALLAEAAGLADGVRAVQVLAELGQARFRLGDLPGYLDCAARIAAVADHADPYQRMLSRFATGWAASLTGDQAVAAPALAEALDLAVARPVTDPQTLTVWQAIVFSPDLPTAMQQASQRLDELRRNGLAGLLVSALTMYTFMRLAVGDHAGAFANAGEAVELAEHLGQVADAATAHEALAWQSAARGLHDAADESLARSAQLLERAGLSSAAAHHALCAAFCALSRDDLEGVVAVLQPRLAIDGGMGLMGEPLGVAPLLVEALVGLGRRAEAAELAERLDEVTPAQAPAVLDAPRHRCLALVEEDPELARAAYDAAITAHAAAPDVFELARTRLLFGSWLRRRGDRVAAREQLGLAADAFGRMELTAWVAKAHAERAATGERARPRGEQPVEEPLTSQETRVALLVAQGLSNKEVAAQLFLSPRTVETHLSSVFRKRGLRNRTDLAVRGLGT